MGRRMILIGALLSLMTVLPGCPTNSIRVLIVNEVGRSVTGLRFIDENTMQVVFFKFEHFIPTGTAMYVNIPKAAKGIDDFVMEFDEGQTLLGFNSPTYSIGVQGVDVFFANQNLVKGWVKLTE